MLFRMFNIELEYLPESAKCSEREHFLESNVRHNPLLSLMSRVSAELTFPRVTHLTFSSPQAPSSLWFSPPRALARRREDVVLCQLYFFRFTPRAEIPVPASQQEPARSCCCRTSILNLGSWWMDDIPWWTIPQPHDNNNPVSLCCLSLAAVCSQCCIFCRGISNLIYCNVSFVLALVCSSHLLTLHPRGWIFHIVSWTAAISRGRRSYYNF